MKPFACDECGVDKYPKVVRCIHCAHYFCFDHANHEAHQCGVKFKCAEQLRAESEGRLYFTNSTTDPRLKPLTVILK